MSTTGWRVGTSVDVAAEHLEGCGRLSCPLRGAALALEHEAADVLVDRGQVAVQELLGLVRLGGDVRAFAQLQRRLLRGRPVAAGAGDEPALVSRDRRRCRASSAATASGSQEMSSPRRARERRDRAGVARRVAVALLDLRRAHDDLVGERPRAALSARPVTSHFVPAKARAASRVIGVSPSWLTSTRRSASRRREHDASSARCRRPSARRGRTCRSRDSTRGGRAEAGGRQGTARASPAAPRWRCGSSLLLAMGASIPCRWMDVFDRFRSRTACAC